MGLAKRIIPVITHKNGQLVKGRRFVNDRVIGSALQAARIYAMRGVDELMLLDVSATEESREPNYDLVKLLSERNFTPLTVGGGVKNAEHVRELLRSGADKVSVGSLFYTNPDMIRELSEEFGAQCITVSIDFKESSRSAAHALACMACEYGAGELLLQAVDRDGTMHGYDIETIQETSKWVDVPVIASCGCADYRDMGRAIDNGADAVAAGALFQFTDATPKGAAEYLHNQGVEVRYDS